MNSSRSLQQPEEGVEAVRVCFVAAVLVLVTAKFPPPNQSIGGRGVGTLSLFNS